MDDLSQTRARLDQLLSETVDRDALAALTAIGEIEHDLADNRRNAVRAAAGRHTWAEIGAALGVSRQAAHHKFAREWADTVKREVKAEHRAHKAALRSGDHAAAEKAKRSRDALIAEIKSAGRGQRKRG
jgi:septal ring-binding cell division protein DamX